MANVPKIKLLDKLMLIPNLLSALLFAVIHLITRPFSNERRPNTLLKDFAFAALRRNFDVTSTETERWTNPTNEKTYYDFAKTNNFQPEAAALDRGLTFYWLGSKTAEKTILYFHGGGYALSASGGHFQWLFDLQKDLSKSLSISIVVVGYTLTPHGQYPAQLKQAAKALQWLLEREEKRPSDVIIAGDSAGGNMTLGLISQLLHPHPEVPASINLSEPLAGALLISPWVKFGTDDTSFQTNRYSDMVNSATVKRWSSLFLGSRPLDNYNQPILADLSWFNGLDLKVKDILVWGGSYEILIDSIKTIAETLKAAHPRTELVVENGACHEGFIIDAILGYKEKGEGTKVIESWISQRW